jgi:hypothetical protein
VIARSKAWPQGAGMTIKPIILDFHRPHCDARMREAIQNGVRDSGLLRLRSQ